MFEKKLTVFIFPHILDSREAIDEVSMFRSVLERNTISTRLVCFIASIRRGQNGLSFKANIEGGES